MNAGESHELLAQFAQDLEAETDPNARIWYEEEFKLLPDYQEASEINDKVQDLAVTLSSALRQKIVDLENSAVMPEPEASEETQRHQEEDNEPPEILSAEEILRERIAKRYNSVHKAYKKDLANISTSQLKTSKKQFLEKQALRKFIKEFTNFQNINGQNHLVMSAEHITWLLDDVIEESEIQEALVGSCEEYAERHGKETSNNPNNFALIIRESLSSQPHSKTFERILKGIFSTRNNLEDFPNIYINLAESTFTLLNQPDALTKIRDMVCQRTSCYNYIVDREVGKQIAKGVIESTLDDSFHGDLIAAHKILATVSNVLVDSSVEYTNDNIRSGIAEYSLRNRPSIPVDKIDYFRDLSDTSKTTLNVPLRLYEINRLDSPYDISGEATFISTRLSRKYAAEIVPYLFVHDNAHRSLKPPLTTYVVPISPSITLQLFAHSNLEQAHEEQRVSLLDGIKTILGETDKVLSPEVLSKVTSYGPNTPVSVVKLTTLIAEEQAQANNSAIYLRPAIQFDKNLYHPLQLLLAHMKSVLNQYDGDADFGKIGEDLQLENNALRNHINTAQTRFLGRRPVKFPLSSQHIMTGLNSISLRIDPKEDVVKAKFSLQDGDVELDLDHDFKIKYGSKSAILGIPVIGPSYYENMILKLVDHWSCKPSVNTSEGTINEETGNSTNMGHYTYLRVLNGKAWSHSDDQAATFKQEQPHKKTTLAAESQRRKQLPAAVDKATGITRNSTYVRERYDPSKPPLEVYCHL